MPPFKLNSPPAILLPGSQIYAYLRDSGHETQELSTQQQQNSLSEWASQHGLIITRFYVDEARRGSSFTGRDQLQELMHDLRHAAPVRAVVVWSYNRFSRGLDDPMLYRAEVRTLGYTFLSLTDDVPDGPIGRIVEAVIDYKNYQYLVDLSIDIRRGQRELVQLHGCMPGTPPVGFRREPIILGHRRDGSPHKAHRWVPDPDTAPLVLTAFRMRAAGSALLEIKAATGFFRSLSSYATLWSNKLYIGILVFSDLVIENYCPPVIPLDLWDAVQERQEHYKRAQHVNSDLDHPRRTHSRYLLSGLLYCAKCDAPVNGNTSSSHGQRSTETYACSNLRKHTCTARRIPRELLEKGIFDTIRSHILNPEIAAELQAIASQSYSANQDTRHAQINSINQRIAKIRTQIRNITTAIKDHGHSSALLKSLADLEQQETMLMSELAQINNLAIAPNLLTPQQLADRADGVTYLLDHGTTEDIRSILKDIIYRIKVENIDKRINCTVYFYSPHVMDPDENVSIVRLPPGAPLYIHSITFEIVYTVGPRTNKTRS